MQEILLKAFSSTSLALISSLIDFAKLTFGHNVTHCQLYVFIISSEYILQKPAILH